MIDRRYQSWGRYPKTKQTARIFHWRDKPPVLESIESKTFLPFGNGRSYGDVCLNDEGLVIDCRELDRFMLFDRKTGILRCEAGVLLSEIIDLAIPAGWFPPVTPGTQFVTVGGAIANDVHGKNHHTAGTFGRHVRRFELLRSTGERFVCSSEQNSEFFHATIGGLGLTGIITWAEIQLRPVKGPYIDREIIRFRSIDEFFSLASESNDTYEHTVAWVDCLAKGDQLGRGFFTRGNHAGDTTEVKASRSKKHLDFFIDPPFTLINSLSLKIFNSIYYHLPHSDHTKDFAHYQSFFYPLDAIYHWNRMYGSKGFFQYQCVVPADVMKDATREILLRIGKAGTGSFLTVLKVFGDKPSPGLLSFPMPGATLALDFPNNGKATLKLLDQLDDITSSVGGRVNPSKDARMHADDFKKGYPNWTRMEKYLDPSISSNFWRRVMASP